MNSIKTSILRADLLGASTSLRSKGQPFYESTFGGIVSILMFLFFLVIFDMKFEDAVEPKLINYR